MLKAKWNSCTITTESELQYMVDTFNRTEHIAGAFDTETNGLHIILCRPFLFQFGWVTPDFIGYTFAVDLEANPELGRSTIEAWHKLAKTLPVYLGHNVKFDLHMLTNIGLPYLEDNLSDTMFFIRYAHDALTPAKGGPPLGLKPYAAQYVDSKARLHEKKLDREKTQITSNLNSRLKQRLIDARCVPPKKYDKPRYNISIINDMFKDTVFLLEDMPEDAKEIYFDWLNNDVPIWLQPRINGLVDSTQIPYNNLNRKDVIEYGHWDIIWTLEVWLKLREVLTARDNWLGVEIENQLIIPIYEMERVGFDANVGYLNNQIPIVNSYIRTRREDFYELAGEAVNIGQHVRIKQILQENFHRDVNSTNSDELEQLCSAIQREPLGTKTPEELDNDYLTIAFIETLAELRTLEKWYATYMLRYQKDLKHTNKLYTTIHQVGTVSGRVSSDFQQFPSYTLKSVYGEELFNPRELIQIPHDEYNAIIYLDYSQIELRFQALYTILVGHPDTNLCRAYMPYQCHNVFTKFDYTDPWCIQNAYTKDWYYDEEPTKKWTPLDVHGATTKEAFNIDESHPNFKRLRGEGKRVNFAKNYGAQFKKICTMFPEKTEAECRKIDQAYYKAFPGVKQYHNYCYNRTQFAYTTNIFGIKYYGVSGHNLINMLIQGSAAFYLKLKIIELHKLRKERGIKSVWQMQIHDELSWKRHKDDPPEIFFEFKRIMEDWTEGYVPVVAEMEVTTSTWAKKKEVNTVDELQVYLGH